MKFHIVFESCHGLLKYVICTGTSVSAIDRAPRIDYLAAAALSELAGLTGVSHNKTGLTTEQLLALDTQACLFSWSGLYHAVMLDPRTDPLLVKHCRRKLAMDLRICLSDRRGLKLSQQDVRDVSDYINLLDSTHDRSALKLLPELPEHVDPWTN